MKTDANSSSYDKSCEESIFCEVQITEIIRILKGDYDKKSIILPSHTHTDDSHQIFPHNVHGIFPRIADDPETSELDNSAIFLIRKNQNYNPDAHTHNEHNAYQYLPIEDKCFESVLKFEENMNMKVPI